MFVCDNFHDRLFKEFYLETILFSMFLKNSVLIFELHANSDMNITVSLYFT